MPTQRESSRKEWTSRDTIEDTNSGSLQRIADAVEKIAASYDQMRNAREFWERRAKENLAAAERLARSNNALRGAITRAKNKLNHPPKGNP
jgi:methyl-accepting chemotaxis protein